MSYRPISRSPILYKVFSNLLLARIGAILDTAQPVGQACFRAGFGCEDHVFTIEIILEKSREFGQEVWTGVCDFCKAFDTVEHCEIWKALDMMGVQKAYIRTLSLLYSGQTGMVITDKKSKTFSLYRGTKQGDLLSPSVFNAVLEMALRNVQEEW